MKGGANDLMMQFGLERIPANCLHQRVKNSMHSAVHAYRDFIVYTIKIGLKIFDNGLIDQLLIRFCELVPVTFI
jgi:hypothetical protein